MKRDAFLRDLRSYCKANGLTYEFDARSGKGGHGKIKVNGVRTVVQTDLTAGRIESILKQLGLPKDAV